MDDFARGETGRPWTIEEIEATVAAYFAMLDLEDAEVPYVKAHVVRDLHAILVVRSNQSIEYKFANISAVLKEDDQRWMGGYAPRSNYQRMLREAVEDRMRRSKASSDATGEYVVDAALRLPRHDLATSDVLVGIPGRKGRGRRSRVDLVGTRRDALQDLKNKALGDSGEKWVVELERHELARSGRADLARRVSWAAHEKGDGLGYDIESFHVDGRLRLIEVKTTRYAAGTPFHITRGEVDFSEDHPEEFSLYRVHGFWRDPRVYILDGFCPRQCLPRCAGISGFSALRLVRCWDAARTAAWAARAASPGNRDPAPHAG